MYICEKNAKTEKISILYTSIYKVLDAIDEFNQLDNHYKKSVNVVKIFNKETLL